MYYFSLALWLVCTLFSSHLPTHATVYECVEPQGRKVFTDSPILIEHCQVLVLVIEEHRQDTSRLTASEERLDVIATAAPSSSFAKSLDFPAASLSPLVKPEEKTEIGNFFQSSEQHPQIPPMIADHIKQRFPSMEDAPWLLPTK